MDFPGARHQFSDRHRLRPWRQAEPYEPTWRDSIGPILQVLAGVATLLLWFAALWLWLAIGVASEASR